MLAKYIDVARQKGWKAFLQLLFVTKTNDGLIQFFRYGFVGGTAAIVDVGIYYSLTEFAGVFYLLSAAIAFVAATLVNYVLSVRWIFQSSGNRRTELLLFTLVGVGGLALNELFIGLQVELWGMHFLPAKLVSLGIVMIWSFTLRRLMFNYLKKKQKKNLEVDDVNV